MTCFVARLSRASPIVKLLRNMVKSNIFGVFFSEGLVAG